MTTDTTPASDLPNLTPLETDAAIAVAWSEPGASMLQIAAKLKLAPDELKEILQRPHVIIYTQAARELQQMREEIAARRDHADTIHNLVTIAKNPDNTVETRLHASIAVLRGVRDGPAPATRATPNPRQYLRPATTPRLALPAPPKPPAPTAPSPTSSAAPRQTSTSADREPQQHASDTPPSPTSALRSTGSNHRATTTTPSAITHAAGAPLPRRAAPPLAPDRPP